MHYLKIVLLTAAFAAIALVVSAEEVGAAEVTVIGTGFENIEIGQTVEVQVTITLRESDPIHERTWTTVRLDGYGQSQNASWRPINVPYVVNYMLFDVEQGSRVSPVVNESLFQQCLTNGYALFSVWLQSDDNVTIYDQAHSIPCSVNLSTVNSVRPPVTEVCGSNNDVLDLSTQPPGVVLSSDTDWENNSRTITFVAASNMTLGDSGVHEFTDFGDCVVIPVVPELLDAVCGSNNDIYSDVTQPANLTMEPSDWENNSRSFTYTPATNYKLPDGFINPQVVTDGGDCIVEGELVSPVVTEVCGPANDVISPATTQPEGVNPVPVMSAWNENSRTLTYSPMSGWVFPDGFTNPHVVTDAGDCITEGGLVPPVVTKVCGPANDVVTAVATQPEGVNPEPMVSDWDEDEKTLTYAPIEHWVFANDAETSFVIRDNNDPCPTDAPVPPVQTAICGPNNDTVTIPPQPDGVTLESDTEWAENSRTIVFAVAPSFVTDGETAFTLTDANEDCPPELFSVSVLLQPSDDGSVEGAEWQLYAPVAAQNFGAQPFAQGTVGAGNTFVVGDLIAGQYRLEVNADGYEKVDTVITVTGERSNQEIVIEMTALQPIATPTPSPTVAPTSEPTSVPVRALPSTGAGSTNESLLAGLALITAATMATIAFVNRKKTL